MCPGAHPTAPGYTAKPIRSARFVEAVVRDALFVSVVLVGKEFARHGDLEAIPLGLASRSKSKLKSIADMMPSPNASSIKAFHAGPSR